VLTVLRVPTSTRFSQQLERIRELAGNTCALATALEVSHERQKERQKERKKVTSYFWMRRVTLVNESHRLTHLFIYYFANGRETLSPWEVSHERQKERQKEKKKESHVVLVDASCHA